MTPRRLASPLALLAVLCALVAVPSWASAPPRTIEGSAHGTRTYMDPAGDAQGGYDQVRQVWTVNEDGNIVFAIQHTSPFATYTGAGNGAYWYLDVDDDPRTGVRVGDIGAEYRETLQRADNKAVYCALSALNGPGPEDDRAVAAQIARTDNEAQGTYYCSVSINSLGGPKVLRWRSETVLQTSPGQFVRDAMPDATAPANRFVVVDPNAVTQVKVAATTTVRRAAPAGRTLRFAVRLVDQRGRPVVNVRVDAKAPGTSSRFLGFSDERGRVTKAIRYRTRPRGPVTVRARLGDLGARRAVSPR